MTRYFEMLISGGQVPRREYWIFTLFAFIVGCSLGFVEGFVGGPGLVVLTGFCGLTVLTPSIVVSVSVLNDANRSGWWLLISLIPLIGSMILLRFVEEGSRLNEN
ncbi:DUF805 domain-containing protein [Candidatus Poribacteria bacterium]|nr:DUF805 domain-containing protein [Candidatus Poribacteria bacterium]